MLLRRCLAPEASISRERFSVPPRMFYFSMGFSNCLLFKSPLGFSIICESEFFRLSSSLFSTML